jgi:hypothetical protein
MSSALFASASHTARTELAELPGVAAVAMPWHAAVILALGWPGMLVAWFSGHARLAPSNTLGGAAVMCVTVMLWVSYSPAPLPPASGRSWGWWGFLALASAANIRTIYAMWPAASAANVRGFEYHPSAALLEASFPASSGLLDRYSDRYSLFSEDPNAPTAGGLDAETREYQRQHRWCAFFYVVGCAVRAIWPRIDVERVCFFDSPLSVTLVGRSLATVAELCFAHQLSLVLSRLGADLDAPDMRKLCLAQQSAGAAVGGTFRQG